MNAKIRKLIKGCRIPIGGFKSRATQIFSFILFLACAAIPAHSQLVTLETRQRAVAKICVDGLLGCVGATESRVNNNSVNSVSHSNNFDGNLQTPSEARTATRSGLREIAANSSMRHRLGTSLRNYTEIFGDSFFEIDILVLNSGDVYFDFLLPPGFVEIESNIELVQPVTLAAIIQADIQTCSPACSYSASNTTLFQMYSILEGGFFNHELTNNTFSVNPSLDTSALMHENINITGNSFLRTKTWEYEAFRGQIFLGHFNAGETFTVSYRMNAETYSDKPGYQTWSAAAINDPFFLSTDPLPQQDIFSFRFEPTADNPPEQSSRMGVCHREGNGSFHLIRVAPQAVRAHRAHGDALPGEDVSGNPGYRFDAACIQVISNGE